MAHDLTLARSLMVCITLFQTDGGYGAMPSDEFDGYPASVILEFDPFALSGEDAGAGMPAPGSFDRGASDAACA